MVVRAHAMSWVELSSLKKYYLKFLLWHFCPCVFYILIASFSSLSTRLHKPLLHVHVSAFLCGHCVFPGLFVRSLVGTLWAHKRETATVSPPEPTRRGSSLVFRILSSPTQGTLKRGLLCEEDPGEMKASCSPESLSGTFNSFYVHTNFC